MERRGRIVHDSVRTISESQNSVYKVHKAKSGIYKKGTQAASTSNNRAVRFFCGNSLVRVARLRARIDVAAVGPGSERPLQIREVL